MLSFAPNKRFAVIRALGSGGMGEVFEVFDREQATTCALKLLPAVTPRALQSFKQEFRALQGLSHPNLIALGELLSEDDRWFFTMELVRGVDFLAYVRDDARRLGAPTVAAAAGPTQTLHEGASIDATAARAIPLLRPAFEEPRLRTALCQLAEGLRFLHDAGKVHRDVKPSNVLVDESGRVVLLDFGLVANSPAAEVTAPRNRDVTIKGTPAYMAPEQVEGRDVGPAADLYAMGAVLFEALTGILPFADCTFTGLLLRKSLKPPRPSELVANVPRALDDLCVELLDPDPGARPSTRDVLARLGSAEVPEAPEVTPFVGRRTELETVSSAYAESKGRPVLVALQGPSGIGKTALLHEMLGGLRARADRPLVLSGRCYEHEGIPYKAIDGVMDELADHLARAQLDLAPALPANAALLGVLFPVLKRVPGFASGVPTEAVEVAAAGDAHEMRRDAERVGRALLLELAARRPLVLSIDDFQWADADSITFLTALARAPEAPPFLLVLSSRTEVPLPFEGVVRRISLEPLPTEDARALAASLLARAGAGVAMTAETIAEEAGGHPFFMSELALRPAGSAARGGDVRLDDVLWDRISERAGAARDVLELVAVAAAPIAQSVVVAAAQLDPASFARATQELRAARLVRTTGIRATDDVETYHDRIRETVVARLAADARADRHLSLAGALERLRPDDLDALVMHYEGGGDGTRAAEYAIRAGDRARAALAFERAASFYRRAIARLSPSVCRTERLHLKLADALANAGIGAEAAIAYERAAEDAEPAVALELRRRAAEHLLSSGRVDEGLSSLGAVLQRVRVRMPRTPATAFASLLFHRARVRIRGLGFVERPAAEIAAADLVRVDALWAAAARLGAIDTIRAADFQARHLLLSLDSGEPFRVARALLAEAVFVAMGGPRRAPRREELLARARSIVSRIEQPYATALLRFAEGFADYQAGRYRPALVALERATELFRTTCTSASHDVAVSKRFEIDCLFDLGELAQMQRQVPLLLEDAERRGDLYLAAELRTGLPNVIWLCADQPDEARRATDLGIARWPRNGFFLQHYYHALASAQIALYIGDREGAHRTVEEAWRGLRRSLLLSVQAVRTEALYLRARAAIAGGGRKALEIGRKTVAELDRDLVPAAAGFAAAARAGLASRARDTEAAARFLRTAERSLAAADVGMYAAACRLHLGRLGHGAAAAETAREAEAWMRGRGIVRPDRFADVLVPGIAASG